MQPAAAAPGAVQQLRMIDGFQHEEIEFPPLTSTAKGLKCALNTLCFPLSICCWGISVPQGYHSVLSYFNEPQEILSPGIYCRPCIGRDVRDMTMMLQDFRLDKLEVNDVSGNPVLMSAVVNWRVTNTYIATFQVSDIRQLVADLSTVALRNIAAHYPFHANDPQTASLCTSRDQINNQLHEDLNQQLAARGAQVVRFVITDVTFTPNMQQLLMKKQEAEANAAAVQVVASAAARTALGVLNELRDGGVVMSPDQAARIASNLTMVYSATGNNAVTVLNNLVNTVAKGDV